MTHLREQAAAVERRSPGHIRQATKLRSSSSTAGFRAADLSNTWIPPHARFPSTQMSRPSETNATMYEMAVVLDRETHAPPGSRSRVAPPDEASVQELPPVDGGCKAWRFCMSAFVLEAYVWGFGFRCARWWSRVFGDAEDLRIKLRYFPRQAAPALALLDACSNVN